MEQLQLKRDFAYSLNGYTAIKMKKGELINANHVRYAYIKKFVPCEVVKKLETTPATPMDIEEVSKNKTTSTKKAIKNSK